MAKPEILETTLPNGKIGNVGYISLSEDTKMTVYSDYLINNKIYTLSFYAKNTSTEGTLLEIIDGIRDGIATYLVTQEWNKVKLTFISNGKNVVVYFPSSDYYLYELKLEEGNTATTWTPSENDTKAETLQSATIQYYKSTNATSMIGGEWSTVTPTWESGYYIWTRTMFIHQDGSVLYSNPACITGEKGDKGDNGTNGTNGTDGISIISVTPIYYCTDDLINPPTTSTLPTEKVTTDSDTAYKTWNLRPATWTRSYVYYFICSQIEYSNGTIGFSSIVQDNSLSKCVTEIITNNENIELKVSKGGSIADINATVASGQSEVKISADAISLEGVVTANENFVIDETGKMHCKDAEIVGGTIKIETSNEKRSSIILNTKMSGVEVKNSLSSYGLRCEEDTQTGYNLAGELNSSEFILAKNKDANNYYGLYAGVGLVDFEDINSSNFISLSGRFNGISKQFAKLKANGDLQINSVKTNAGADLDAVKAKVDTVKTDLDTVKDKVDGRLKSTFFGNARGTESAYPSVDVSSIQAGTKIRIEVGVPIDNNGTIGWFSYSTVKSVNITDYLLNIGGYYYSNTYNGSIFVNLSNTRITINDSWTKIIGGTANTTVANLKSLSRIYVYTENL